MVSRTHRKRLLVVCISGLTLGILIAITFPRARFGTITTDSLSPRAQEFVGSEQQKNLPVWNQLNLDSSRFPLKDEPETLHTACFSLMSPLPVRSIEKLREQDCILTLRIASPPSRLTISMAKLNSKLQEHPALMLRNSDPTTFTAIPYNAQRFTESQLYKEPQGLSFFASVDSELLTIIFSETSEHQTILQQSMQDMLANLSIISEEARRESASPSAYPE